ncbi:MAG TPA: hypothetical protein VFX85_00960 [Solirubrobacterales bacterium]|nr:hypothetical protein [Solirubrobacterales bacterium]
MSSRMSSGAWLALAIGVATIVGLGLLVVLSGEGKGGEPAPTVIVCVDSTISTDPVRESYLPDLKAIARRAARARAPFYADACGENATGTVNWKVRKQFDDAGLGGELDDEAAEGKLPRIEEQLGDLVEQRTVRGGTPLGDMLAVTARQCAHRGGACEIYLFTDGEWADATVHVAREPISDEQESKYIDLYGDQLGGLDKAEVNFVGVGHGTDLDEPRLNEARELAEALIAEAEGEMGAWTTAL